MASRSSTGPRNNNSNNNNNKQRWCAAQPLTPLMEGPDPEMQEQSARSLDPSTTSSNWDTIREWFRHQKTSDDSSNDGVSPPSVLNGSCRKQQQGAKNSQDLRLLLGVLGCPLAPIPIPLSPPSPAAADVEEVCNPGIKDIPMAKSMAHYIIKQYLAATGCLKGERRRSSMYAAGSVKMIRCETEVSSGKNVKSLGGKSAVEHGSFVLWQMLPSMWSLELAVGIGGGDRKNNCNYHHLLAGSDGKTVWRHTPWLGTHAAKGPQRPLRRIIQGLDPKSTGKLFGGAEWVGEQTIGEEECFVLKVAAERAAVMERSEGPAEVLRHVLYGYFSQKSGLLVYLEDSHLTRVSAVSPNNNNKNDIVIDSNIDHDEISCYVYWETTIGSRIGDYREVDGVMIAHEGRSIATVFRFEEQSVQHSRTRMEEVWRIDDVVFNVPGLSLDHFIPPADIFVP